MTHTELIHPQLQRRVVLVMKDETDGPNNIFNIGSVVVMPKGVIRVSLDSSIRRYTKTVLTMPVVIKRNRHGYPTLAIIEYNKTWYGKLGNRRTHNHEYLKTIEG